MGLTSALKGVFKSGDEAASVGSKQTKLADEVASNTDDLPNVDAGTYRQQLMANLAARGVEQPAKVADSAFRNTRKGASGTAKVLGGSAVGLGGLYVGGQAANKFANADMMESREASYAEMMQRIKEIRNSDMSPDQKEEAIAQLLETWEDYTENTPGDDNSDDDGGPLADIFAGMGPMKMITLLIIVMIAYNIVNTGGGR